eukprot:7496132-Alexandrium_andersonii.AAC.1
MTTRAHGLDRQVSWNRARAAHPHARLGRSWVMVKPPRSLRMVARSDSVRPCLKLMLLSLKWASTRRAGERVATEEASHKGSGLM